MGFVGPKNEAEEIRRRLSEFLGHRLKLTLSPEKTLITHATDGMAKFLGYELTVTRKGDLITANGKRNTNGKITLRMPREVLQRYLDRFSRGGKVRHATELLSESDYTIVQRHQSVLRGLYNYYCMAINVGTRKRMPDIKWVLEQSLTKTLACKHRCSVRDIYSRYRVEILGLKALRVVLERPEKEPLIATFGGIPLTRIPEGMGTTDFDPELTWLRHHTGRAEVVTRLLAGRCELCEAKGVPLEVHHIRKLADINRPGRRPKAKWEQIMSATRRRTIVLCTECHDEIHAGRYDGPSF